MENKMKHIRKLTNIDTYDLLQNRLVRPYLYGAYGSNLDEEQMIYRCPNATKVGKMTLYDYELVFRNVADLRTKKDASIELGLWEITKGCENRLDTYEGYPDLYDKFKISNPELEYEFGYNEVMLYQMVDRKWLAPPSESYFQGIVQGYQDFDMDKDYLLYALKRSFNEETPLILK